MIINRNNINEILSKCNIKPDKDYGQNFLVDPNIAKRIVDSLEINDDDVILEIGPGLGSLSHFLAEYPNPIDLVDIDVQMTSFLKVIYQDNKNITIIQNDIKKQNVEKYSKIVANLPYNITSETISYLLLNATKTRKMVLMCQKETYAHVGDVSGSEYGPLSVLIHLLGKTKKLFSVKKGSFVPVPKIDSVVFEINIEKELDEEITFTYQLTKALFLNRRKTIHNNLGSYLKDKVEAENILNKLNISTNLRPEQISPEQYLELGKLLILLSKQNS